MTRVFSGPLSVHYAQAYVLPAGSPTPLLQDCFRGQTNGLCGATRPQTLFLVTGLHTGYVGFTVDVLDASPPLDDAWEEIVEVSLSVVTSNMALVQWAGYASYPIPLLPGSYRARYCARGMQRGREVDTSPADADPLDFYSLTFWPAPPARDSIARTTTAVAAYLHQRFPARR